MSFSRFLSKILYPMKFFSEEKKTEIILKTNKNNVRIKRSNE